MNKDKINKQIESLKRKHKEKDTRTVRCYICKKKMYYIGHSKFEPEYQIVDDDHHFIGYIHKRCLK